MSGDARRRLLRVVLLIVSTAVSLALAEALYRAQADSAAAAAVPTTGDQYRFYRYDPLLGWSNMPGAVGTFARDEFRYDVRINRHGMRQAEVDLQKPPGTRRIAVLGDSFVWGIGVDDGQRFTERLAAELRSVEVLNFGVSGYAPVQHLLGLEQVLRFAPDLVLLAFCLGNDFVDNVQFVRYGYYKPYAALDEQGALRIEGREVPNTRTFGFAVRPRLLGSELLGALARSLGSEPALAGQRGLTLLTERDMYADDLDAARKTQRDAAIAVNEALLAEIARRLHAAGVELLVVPAPSKFEYNRSGATGHEGTFDQLERTLAASCARCRIAFLPTVHRLHGSDFWLQDGHWNARGHQKIAAAIAEHLAGSGFERVR